MPQVKAREHSATDADRKDAQLHSSPDVPTAIESGFTGFEAYAWWGVFAPAGTPKPIVERFAQRSAECLREEPTVNKQLTENQQVTLPLGGPAMKQSSSPSRWGCGGRS